MYLRYLGSTLPPKVWEPHRSSNIKESVMREVRVRNSMFRTHVVVRAIAVACLLSSLSVVGLAQAGSLDPTFGHHGIFTTNFATCCGGVNAITLQSDGKILVGGQAQITRLVGVIFRLNPNGTL